MSKLIRTIMVSLIAVCMGLLTGGIIMVIVGYNPFAAYDTLFSTAFANVHNIGEILRVMTPLILIALGFAVSSKAGFFNVGLPGQALLGWTAAGTFAVMTPDMPKIVSIPLSILIAMLAGGLAASIPGVLRAFCGASEVITTIMMNYIILYATNAFVMDYLVPHYSATGKGVTVKIPVTASYKVDWLTEFFDASKINLGIFMAVCAVIIVWFMMNKTTLGYEITVVGFNSHAAEYAGMSAKRLIIIAMMISGALAGLGGAIDGLGTYSYIKQQTASLSIGWTGMAVALLAANSPIGIPFAALLYGILEVGKSGMQAVAAPEIIDVISALIIFFVAIHAVIERLLPIKKSLEGGQS